MKRKRMTAALCAVLLLASAILGGCQRTDTEQTASEAAGSPEAAAQQKAEEASVIVTMPTTSEPEAGFDPVYGWGAGEHVHEPLIQSTLTTTTADLEIGMDLAVDYSVSEDGLLWTVTIRDDAYFTDGEKLTASDVAFTYNLCAENSSVNDFTMLESAVAVDDVTVEFHMNRPFSIWPYTMAVVGIVPEHAYDSETYGRNPIGSGLYILKQWDQGQQVILEANPDYYGEAPKMKRVTVLFMEEDAAFLAAQAGEVDLAYTSATYSDQEIDGYELAAYASVDNRGFNLPAVEESTDSEGRTVGNDFTSDVLVRRAINIGIDRQEMIDHVLNGYGSPAYSVCDRLPWYNEASEVEYDPGEAAALLDEAGWTMGDDGIREKDGVKLSAAFLYQTGTASDDNMVVYICDQASKIGIELTPQSAQMMDWYAMIQSGDYGLTIFKTQGGYYDPAMVITNINPSTSMDPILMQIGASQPELASLVDELDSATDEARIQEIYNTILTTMADQCLTTPLIYTRQLAIYSDAVASYTFPTDASFTSVQNIHLN